MNPRDFFSTRQLDRSESFQRGLQLIWIGATVVQLAVLAVAVWLTPRSRWRGIPGGVALGALTLVAVWAAGLPFVLVAHWWRRRYGVSRSDYGTILVDLSGFHLLGEHASAAACMDAVLLVGSAHDTREQEVLHYLTELPPGRFLGVLLVG